MRVNISEDEAALAELVHPETFVRGLNYREQGRVHSAVRDEDGRIVGRVRGSGSRSYSTIVDIGDLNGTPMSFRGLCSCPVGENCKHAVALALVALGTPPSSASSISHPGTSEPGTGEHDNSEPGSGEFATGGLGAGEAGVAAAQPGGGTPGSTSGRRTAGRKTVRRAPVASWESALRDLVADDDDRLTEPIVALQIELVQVPATRYSQAHPSLRFRPVIKGRSGGWIRTGISWSNLGALSYSHRRLDREHAQLLSEIVAMASTSRYFSYGSAPMQLEDFATGRIWDLLGQAQASGIVLVQNGKKAGPVRLSAEPAVAGLDLVRREGTLTATPQLSLGAERVQLSQAMLLGRPAHGLAWVHDDAATPPGLTLARLGGPITDTVAALLGGGALVIPEADEERFFSGYYPKLRNRVQLSATDGSVELPAELPPELVLQLEHAAGPRIELRWQWRYPHLGVELSLYRSVGSREQRDDATEQQLLAEVGDALKPIEACWDAAEEMSHELRLAPSVRLGGIDAVRFTTEILPALTAIAGVTIESSGISPHFRAAEHEPVISISDSGTSDQRDWFDLGVTVSVDDEQVVFEDLFLALAHGDSHLILASGTYFSLDRPEFARLAALIAEARALQDAPANTIRLSRYQASLWADLEELGAVLSQQASQWQQSIRSLAAVTELPAVAVPTSLHAVLRPYQQQGLNWLAFLHEHQLGGILADEMGLGKTLQALALICHARQVGDDRPFLVVAPTSVVSNWASEAARFAPTLNVAAVSQTQLRRGTDLATALAEADVVVTSYTLFRLEFEQYQGLQWAGLILDEAQFVKNHASESYRCAKKLAAPVKLAITGTPMENNLGELWALLSITAPGLFASVQRFNDYYRTPIEKGHNADRLAQLRRRVKPLMLRRSKSVVLAELPAKQEQVLELELNAKHRRIYDRHLQRERQKVLGLLGDLDKNRFEIFRSLTLLRQASLDVGLIDDSYAGTPSTKLDAMMELLTEVVSEGHRTLVFSQFTRFLRSARQRLESQGIGYCYLDGATRQRAGVLAEFKNGDAPVFLISLKAGGFGLNLTDADYCILLDPWWNPATEAQAVDRVHRIGQANKVNVYRLVARDTIEEKVMALKAAKAELFSSVLDGGEFASAKLTESDIRGLLE